MSLCTTPALPQSHPHRRIILDAWIRVAKSSTGAAFRAGLIGSEVMTMALKAAAFDLVIAQHGESDHDRGQSIAEAMLTAIGIAETAAVETAA